MKSYIKGKVGDFQQKHAKSGIIIPSRDIMYGLIYPAVLGTGLVLTVLRATKEVSVHSRFHDSALYVAFAAGLFYSFSFTSGSEKKDDKSEIAYGWRTFLFDFLEVVLMFLCFYFLGLLDDRPIDPHLAPAYVFLLIDVVVIQPLWRLFAGVDIFYFGWTRLIVAGALAGGIIAGLFPGDIHPWVDLLVCVVLSYFVFRYIKMTPEFHLPSSHSRETSTNQ